MKELYKIMNRLVLRHLRLRKISYDLILYKTNVICFASVLFFTERCHAICSRQFHEFMFRLAIQR